jgi:N-methylhydantoinase A
MSHLVGVDIGGTFTDFVSFDTETNAAQVWKNPSTPDNPFEGVLTGLSKIPHLDDVERLRLGTTIATNAILQRAGATVAYVTTKGFRDIPFIQRGNRKAHYDMTWIKAKPLAKRRHCFELDERIDADGAILRPLDDHEVRALAAKIKAEGEIEAVAVNFLFSYINPVHELRAKEIFAEELPGIPLSISFEVLPKWKEYERASTTLADAYVKPLVIRTFATMSKQFSELGLAGKVAVMKSNGGESSFEGAAAHPVQMTLSGPTGGVVASRALSQLIDVPNLVTFDMGGTSTDCATVINGEERLTTNFEIEWGLPIQIPMIDVRTIGAGGGSIAWMDKGGLLQVGPQSAGADPAPASYGKGGTEPTVTDANLVLGRLNEAEFLGGEMRIDTNLAREAIKKIANQLDFGLEETANAIVQIANNNMIGALRSVLLERGHDPRDFTLLGFGGAGPLHLNELMILENIPRGIVPIYPGQFSAFGFIMTDARTDKQRTIQQTSARFDQETSTRLMDELVAMAVTELRDQGYTQELEIYRTIDLRYLGQNYELQLPFNADTFSDETLVDLWNRFHETHQTRFDFHIPGETIEMVNLSIAVVAPSRKPSLATLAAGSGSPEKIGERQIWFEAGFVNADVYDRIDFHDGQHVAGPAIIREAASTTILCPGYLARCDAYGNLHISAKGS